MFSDNRILDGKSVRLEPTNSSHIDALCDVVRDGNLWELFYTLVPSPEQLKDFLSTAVENYERGDGLTFVTIEKNTNLVVGSTRFMKAVPGYKKVEIGYTFIASRYQRTCVNTEAKYLMLCHAFEKLELNRVEFLTDYLNARSRNAILRLGAKEEGLLRNHMIMPNGRIRDSMIFSIIKNEWPGVKMHLESKLTHD